MRALKIKGGAHAGGHSAEELKLIVSSSRGLGYLPEVAGGHDPPRARPGNDRGPRDHGAAQRHRLDRLPTPRLDEVLADHDRAAAFAPARSTRDARRRSSASCTTRTCCRSGRSAGAPSAPAGPAAPSASSACCARTWWCPRPSPLSQMLEEFRAGPLAHGDGGGRVRHHRRPADGGGRAGTDRRPDRGRARREDRAAARPRPTKWNWTAPPASATWRPNSASRFPADAGFETLAGFPAVPPGRHPARRRRGGIPGPALHRAGDGPQPDRARAHREAAGAAR